MERFRLPGSLGSCLFFLNLIATPAHAVAVSDQWLCF
jgi:hypothetical protein